MFDKKNKYFKTSIFYLFLYLIFIFIFPFLRGAINKKNVSINTPATVLKAADSSTNFFSSFFINIGNFFSSKKDLALKIDELNSQILELKKQTIIQKISEKDMQKIVIAKKIFTDSLNMYNTILVDKGSESGVQEGDFVYVDGDKVIGRIERVNLSSSIVNLISKDKYKSEASILGEKIDISVKDLDNPSTASSSQEGLLDSPFVASMPTHIGKRHYVVIDVYGYGSGDFVAQVPENIYVSTGTEVLLAENESKVLGQVVKVEHPEASFFQVVLIRGYYNPRLNNDYYIDIK